MSGTVSNGRSGIGLIGGGLVAYLHALGIRSSHSGQLAAISSRSTNRARHMGLLLGAPHYAFTDHTMMFARNDIDLLVIGSPNGTHAEHARAALQAGKAIIVEKPLTLTLADAAELVERERNGAFIGYAENHVFAPVMAALRDEIGKGTIGTVRRVEGHFYNPPLSADNWHASPALSGGGALVDLGSHLIATMEWLLGTDLLAEVSSSTIEMDPVTNFDRRADVILRSTADVEVRLSCGFGIDPLGCGYKVTGDDGSLTVNFMPDPQRLSLERTGHEVIMLPFDGSDIATIRGMFTRTGYAPQIDHFIAARASGARPVLGAREGERTLRWISASYLAAASKRAIRDVTELDTNATPVAHLSL